ncbi:MAG TPA: Xaa-Pro peptidase family protein [Baekduia sp.]|uniref:M24 family metallopeptidase n=1 Tax=Baekduia sp. TaxID=2600305 RepID=UPI002D782EBA|nr:Xaa-Pro peptidase family protein [Baekduia sp.]HET6509710.1 Xaa-Pro peptidase family protein [Baekduia sp.]
MSIEALTQAPKGARIAPRMAVSLEEYQDRVRKTREWMHANDVDLLLLNQPEHYNWLSGYDPTSVFYHQTLIVPADDGEPLTLLCNKAELALCDETCWVEDVRVVWTHEDQTENTMDALRDRGLDKPKRVGLNLMSYHLRPQFAFDIRAALSDAEAVDVTQVVDDLRLVKSPAEIEHLRHAAHIADLGVTAGINAIREGVTDFEVMAAIQHATALNGGEFPAYPFLVDARGTLHGTPTGKILRPGDTIYMEVSGVKRRYHCNISRTAIIGEPPAKTKEIYDVAKRALDEATAAMVPGATVGELVELVAQLHSGYEKNTWGRFGFSMEISYPPIWIGGLSLMKGDDHVIEAGQVITMEPGLSYADGVTIGLGNNVLITEHGPEILNNVPVELFVR